MDYNNNKKPKSKPQENLNEETLAMNAIAKALMVSLAWSQAGLNNTKNPTKTQPDNSKVWVNLRPLAE